jgi:N-acetylglucosamine-6-phosphate deacetylase
MLSWTPARVANLQGVGNLKSGCRADVLCFDENLGLQKTIVAGKVVYSKQ